MPESFIQALPKIGPYQRKPMIILEIAATRTAA
jgi:hypothetical protein